MKVGDPDAIDVRQKQGRTTYTWLNTLGAWATASKFARTQPLQLPQRRGSSFHEQTIQHIQYAYFREQFDGVHTWTAVIFGRLAVTAAVLTARRE